MAKKQWSGLVFSTNPDLMRAQEEQANQPLPTLPPAEQPLRIRMERKGRGGKVATIVAGFEGSDADLQELAKRLKVACGTGGSAKEGDIIIQGDRLQQVKQLLIDWGYKRTKG